MRALIIYSLCLSCFFSIAAFGQDEDWTSKVDYRVNKMKKELSLTDAQVAAVKPVIKDYLTKRQAVLADSGGGGILDSGGSKSTLKSLKIIENQNLSKILTPDQMQKWLNKENMMAALNPDSSESPTDDEGVGLAPGGAGANMKF